MNKDPASIKIGERAGRDFSRDGFRPRICEGTVLPKTIYFCGGSDDASTYLNEPKVCLDFNASSKICAISFDK